MFSGSNALSVFFRLVLFLSLMVLPVGAFAQSKIGLSLPLTGSTARLAQQFLVGASLALKVHNRTQQSQFEMLVVDDACDEEIGKLAAQDLLSGDVSIVTGLLCNSATNTIATQLAASNIPLLVAGARSERLIKDREREGWNLWRLSPGDSDAAALAGDILSKKWAGKAYGIVDDGTVYGRNMADAFRAIMEDQNLPPQFTDNFRPTQSTQARLIRRLRRAGITHVFIGGSAEDVALVAKNSIELSIPLEIVGGETLSIMPYLDRELIPPDGLMAIVEKSAVKPALSDNILTLFAAEKIEPELHVLAGYQAIEVALQAIRADAVKTQEALNTNQFTTLLGSVSFDASGKNTAQQYGFFQWQNGKFEQANQW